MGFGNLFESITCNFFCNNEKRKNKKKKYDNLYEISEKLKISIIPTPDDLDIDNLYPIKNHVIHWNTFIIGKDKKYILSNIGNEKCLESSLNINAKDIVDTFGDDKFPTEFYKFMDHVWDIVLTNKQVQLYIVMSGSTYLINSYPIVNKKGNVIGGILFMRDFDNMDKYSNVTINH